MLRLLALLIFFLNLSHPAWAQTGQAAQTSTAASWLTVPFAVSTSIALVALFRPNLETLIRRWRNRVELFEAKRIEIGFGDLGPTLGIAGTITGIPNDQFIRSIGLTLIRRRDNLTHKFEWAAFRPVGIFPADPKDIRAPMGFKLAAGDGQPVNILFVDDVARQHSLDELLKLRNAWTKYSSENKAIEGQLDPRQEYENFTSGKATDVPSSVYTEISQAFYFVAGDYDLSVAIETWNPSLHFQFSYQFSITKDQERELRFGIVGSMHLACQHPDGRAYFTQSLLTRTNQ